MNMAYKKLKKQLSFVAIYKISIFLINYILIALLVSYLGEEGFGVYIALTSLSSWMFLFDLGIAKGMRNFVTISIKNNNVKESIEYISTSYISIFFVAMFFFIGTIKLLYIADLNIFLNGELDLVYLQDIFFILIVGFFLRLYLSTVDQLNYATHQSQNVSLNSLLVIAINFIGIYLLLNIEYIRSIKSAILVFSISIVIPYLYTTSYFFYKNNFLIPSITKFSKKALINIFYGGSKILYIQVCFLLIIGLDRLILLKYSSSTEVFKYEIIYKIMGVVVLPISIIMEPLWSSFSEAYSKGDIKWIKSIFIKFYILLSGVSIVMFLLIYFFDFITFFWISKIISVNIESLFIIGLLILSIIIGNFYSSFLLGNNKLLYMTIILSVGLFGKLFILFIFNKYSIIEINSVAISSLVAYILFISFTPFYIRNILKK